MVERVKRGGRGGEFDVAGHIGNGDEQVESEGVAVRVSTNEWGERSAFLMPVKLRNASPRQQALIRDCQAAVRLNVTALAQLDELVPQMRAAGLSWGSIGWCVGISSAAALKRWGGHRP